MTRIHSAYGRITPALLAKTNDWSPTGLEYCQTIAPEMSATTVVTGLAALGRGARRRILNAASSDYLLLLENQSSNSSAANRLILPNHFPGLLMPGDSMEFEDAGGGIGWELVSVGQPGGPMGLTEFTDFLGSSPSGQFTATVSGTGASTGQATTNVNTTEAFMGCGTMSTGTTTTGRATIGGAHNAGIVPTIAAGLSVVRLQIPTAVDGTETYSVVAGWQDFSGGTWNDGAAWEYRWTGSAVEWSQTLMAATSATRSATGSPTDNNTSIVLIQYTNRAWTRSDFIYSQDSVSFTKAGSPTTGHPSSTQYPMWGVSIVKSAGTTARVCNVDYMGYRIDQTRT